MVDQNNHNEHSQALDEFVMALNEKLENASQSSMTRAFNLGCSTGLVPAILAVIAVFYLFEGSMIGAAFTALVLALGILAFANISGYLAKARTIQRVYKEQINPEIDRILVSDHLTRQEFDIHADLILPQEALLRMFLKPGLIEDDGNLSESTKD